MKTLTLENKDELLPFLLEADYNEYNSNIVTMLMWSNMYEVQFEVYEHYAIARSLMPHRSAIWMMPYCRSEYRKEAIEKIKQRSIDLAMEFEIHSMTVSFKNWLQETYQDEFLIWDCFNAQDYIYDRKQQETLIGKKMQKRRNHFHAFMKEYEGRYVYKSIEEEDIPHIYSFLQTWKSSKEQDQSIDAEEIGIHILLENRHTLPIQGGCIYIDGTLEAFNITSRLSSDTIQIHVEKANRMMRGLYIAILKFFLETLDENIVFINREDDLGLEDLRKAKKDMQPVKKIQKFGCCHQRIEIKLADETYRPQIEALWLQRFEDETKESTQYYFDHIYDPSTCYVLVSEGELIAMLQARKMKIMAQDTPQSVSLIVGVATNTEYEGCGYMKRLLHYVIEQLQKEENYVLLQAYNPSIYIPFGFEEIYQLARTKVDKSKYSLSNGVFSSQFDTSDLLAIYQTYTKNKNGYRIRTLDDMQQQVQYATLWDQHYMVHKSEDTIDAYIVMSQNEQEIHVHECIYASEEALHSLLALLCKEEKLVYVSCDIDTQIEGRRKLFTTMMAKALHHEQLLAPLFIHEEL